MIEIGSVCDELLWSLSTASAVRDPSIGRPVNEDRSTNTFARE
jgi:hypothetical protein